MPIAPPPVAPAWITAAQSANWQFTVTATLWNSPSPGPQKQIAGPIPISDGSITIDRTNVIRRNGTLVIADPLTWLPTSLLSQLAPNGNELHLEATATVPVTGGGFTTTSPISLGWFAITDVTIMDTGYDVTLSVAFFDRAWAIAERKFGPGGWSVLPTYALYQMIRAVADHQYPGLSFNVQGANGVTPLSTFAQGDDPWADMQNAIASAALGYELYLDMNGVITGHPAIDPTTVTPIWSFNEGPTNTVTSIQRVLTRTGIANDMVRSSAGTATAGQGGPFQGEVSEDHQQSPMWVGSQFGRIYNFNTAAFITSTDTALAVAKNDLTLARGQTDLVTLTAIPLPFLDIDSVITITRSRLGLNAAPYVIDSITLPFRYDAEMSIVARSVVMS